MFSTLQSLTMHCNLLVQLFFHHIFNEVNGCIRYVLCSLAMNKIFYFFCFLSFIVLFYIFYRLLFICVDEANCAVFSLKISNPNHMQMNQIQYTNAHQLSTIVSDSLFINFTDNLFSLSLSIALPLCATALPFEYFVHTFIQFNKPSILLIPPDQCR